MSEEPIPPDKEELCDLLKNIPHPSSEPRKIETEEVGEAAAMLFATKVNTAGQALEAPRRKKHA
jgi:hypothetical protein